MRLNYETLRCFVLFTVRLAIEDLVEEIVWVLIIWILIPYGSTKWRSSILSAVGNGLSMMPPDGSVLMETEAVKEVGYRGKIMDKIRLSESCQLVFIFLDSYCHC